MRRHGSDTYGIRLQELLAVKYGIKPLLRTVLRTDDPKGVERLCRENKLFCMVKSFNKLYGSVLNPPVKIVYISATKDLLNEAYTSDKSGDRKHLGELLGYPPCCVEFFLGVLQHFDLPFPIKTYNETNGKPSFLANNIFKMESRLRVEELKRFQKNPDFARRVSHLFLISHVPCSYRCKESIRIGREMLDMLEMEEPELAREIVSVLKKPLLFFDDLRWIIFNGKVEGNILNYSSISPPFSLLEKEFVGMFEKGDTIRVGKEFIEIYGEGRIIHRVEKKHEYDGVLLDFS